MEYRRPKALRKGDVVAIVSPSWGGPSVFPRVYENGLAVLREWGLEIREYPSARADAGFLRAHPEFRAKDLNDAFADPDIKAVFASIGGDDSVRILRFLDKDVIAKNPKIIMGYSDTTAIHAYCHLLGLVTFNGPSVIAGFSQMESLPASFREHVRSMLFDPADSYTYVPFDSYSDGYPDWSVPENLGKVKEPRCSDGWRVLQGSGIVEGGLFGGCIEVLEFLKGTEYWPDRDFWDRKILFFETSEGKPSLDQVRYMLMNYGVQGVFDKVSGILFGRAREYSDEEKRGLDEMLVRVIGDEFGHPNLPIISNMDFGHTDPQWVMPLGVRARFDIGRKEFSLVEPWLTA